MRELQLISNPNPVQRVNNASNLSILQLIPELIDPFLKLLKFIIPNHILNATPLAVIKATKIKLTLACLLQTGSNTSLTLLVPPLQRLDLLNHLDVAPGMYLVNVLDLEAYLIVLRGQGLVQILERL